MAEIRLEHVSFTYEAHGQRYQALEDVNLNIADGEFVCVTGRSGCGKTTLLRLLSGLQLPTNGAILINGSPLTGPDTSRAMVFQNYTLFPWMTARENVRFGIRQAQKSLSRKQARELAEEYLRRVDMEDTADKYPYQLSGGMRQRVAIARALAMDSEILLLDEPFGALDARNRSQLQVLLEQLWSRGGDKRKTVVFVTHDIQEAVSLGSRILYMVPGRISEDFSVELPYPRNALDGQDGERLQELQNKLLDLFYRSGGGESSYEE